MFRSSPDRCILKFHSESESLRALRVLIVEDNPTDRALIRLVLAAPTDVVATFDEAESGDEAVELLRADPYDMVIADNQIFGPLSGIDVLHLARTLQPFCRRVFITGDCRARVLEDARRRAQPAACLTKDRSFASNVIKLLKHAPRRDRGGMERKENPPQLSPRNRAWRTLDSSGPSPGTAETTV